jgi:DNA-binding transcriptional regulator YhcF (GntR family)
MPIELTASVVSPQAVSAQAVSPKALSPEVNLAESTLAPEEGARLSYKFQRLREKLREAIASGELSGRLPGERKLARRFRVNAKTLSKALTDLAAEGLLDRSIGRGTFIKGTALPQTADPAQKWLIICDPEQAASACVQQLLAANPEAHCSIGMPPQRPSFLNPFKAVVIFSPTVPDPFVRDLVVRNIPVVAAGRQPSTYSTHSVLIDRSHGAAVVARDLLLAGHRRVAVVEERGSIDLATAVRQAAARYAPEAAIEPMSPPDVANAVEQGTTAVICDSSDAATAVRSTLEELQLEMPRQISLAVIGTGDGECNCSGYFVSPEQFSRAIIDILRDNTPKRPITLFLAGQSIDRGTIGPTDAMIDPSARIRYTGVSA